MDYPVLVNPGKPSYACPHREGHEEENQSDPLWGRKTAEKCRGRAQSRAAAAPSAHIRVAGGLYRGQINDSKTQDPIGASERANRGVAGLGRHRFPAGNSEPARL